IDLGSEYGIGQFDFADFLSVQIDYIHDWHNFDSFSNSRNLGGSAYFALCDLRMKMYCPLGPGTDPRTSSRFSSVSTLITFKFLAVTLWLPMCPGKCWFFQTREGNELPPIPPGARWNIEPCVASPPA